MLNKTVTINFKNGEQEIYETTSYAASKFKAQFENKEIQWVELFPAKWLKNTIANIEIR